VDVVCYWTIYGIDESKECKPKGASNKVSGCRGLDKFHGAII
jgi:hypothetical protein